MTYEEIEIPEDLAETAASWRANLIEAVAESNEELLEKFFEDEDSITEEEIMDAIREATVNMSVNSNDVWVSFQKQRSTNLAGCGDFILAFTT